MGRDLQVDQKPLKTVAEFSSEVKEGEKRNRVSLLIRKGNMQRFVALSW
jgi:serine protease Do